MCSKLKRNKWEKKCLQLFIFTREKKNRVVWFGFDSTPRNGNWLLRCLSFLFLFVFLRYNGFQIHNIRKLRQNRLVLEHAHYILLFLLKSFSAWHYVPNLSMCKTNQKEIEKKLVIFVRLVVEKTRCLLLFVFVYFDLILPSGKKPDVVALPISFLLKMSLCVFFSLVYFCFNK